MRQSVNFVVVAVVLAVAASSSGKPASQPTRYKNVRQIDWKNFTYPTGRDTCDLGSDCGNEPLKVVKGVSQHSCASESELFLRPVVHADVTGDDGDEALVVFDVGLTNVGGMQSVSCAYLYALRDELPVIVWAAGKLPVHLDSFRLEKRTFSFDLVRGGKRYERHTYTGTPDFKLKLVKKEKVKPEKPGSKAGRR